MAILSNLTIENSFGLHLTLTFAHIVQFLDIAHVIVDTNVLIPKISKHKIYTNVSNLRNLKTTLLLRYDQKSPSYMIKIQCLTLKTHNHLLTRSKMSKSQKNPFNSN